MPEQKGGNQVVLDEALVLQNFLPVDFSFYKILFMTHEFMHNCADFALYQGTLLLSAYHTVCSDIECLCLDNEASLSSFHKSIELASKSCF